MATTSLHYLKRSVWMIIALLLGINLFPPLKTAAVQNDKELRTLAREVTLEGKMDNVEQAVKEARALDTVHGARVRHMERQRAEALSGTRKRELAAEIIEATNEHEKSIGEIIERVPSEKGRRLAASLRRTGVVGAALLGFLSSEALGAVEVFARPGSKVSALYRRALQGQCEWVYPRTNDPVWRTEIVGEFLSAGVKLSDEVSTAYFDKLRQACRPIDIAGVWIGVNYKCGGLEYDEIVRITVSGRQVVATKKTGDSCVAAGQVSWTASFDGWQFTNGLMTLGVPDAPARQRKVPVGIRLIDKDKVELKEQSGVTTTFVRSL